MMFKKAFTLTELLVVIILVGILASLAIPKFGGSTNKAMELEARMALKQVQTLQKVYYLEHKTYGATVDAIDFEQEATVTEDPENGGAKYKISITSADGSDFVATAVPQVADLKTFEISKIGKPKVVK